eukprot:364743-Chlamydomonas_euryale.AAC.39
MWTGAPLRHCGPTQMGYAGFNLTEHATFRTFVGSPRTPPARTTPCERRSCRLRVLLAACGHCVPMIATSCAPLIDRASMIKASVPPVRGGAHNSLAGARSASHASALRVAGRAAARGRVQCGQQRAFKYELSARTQHVAPSKQPASRRAPWVSTASAPTASGNPAPLSDDRPPRRAASGQHGGFQVDALAVAVFILLAAGGAIFYIKLETMPPVQAALHSIKKLLAIAAARQLLAIAVTMLVIKCA